MHLYVEAMDAVLVDYDPDGRVRFEGEEWSTPTLQETRAILHAAHKALETLQELMQMLEAADR